MRFGYWSPLFKAEVVNSYLAPAGICEFAQSAARSNAHFEAERFRKILPRRYETTFEERKSLLRQGDDACPSNDLERPMAADPAEVMISSAI